MNPLAMVGVINAANVVEEVVESNMFRSPAYQGVRMIDVFLLGPLMIWFANASKSMPNWSRAALAVSGVATILFNARGHMAVERGLLLP